MFRSRAAVLGTAFGAVSTVAVAAPPVVTESEFLAALKADHPAVAARREGVEQARIRVLAEARYSNPVLSAVHEDVSGPEAEISWALSWRLPEPLRGRRLAARESSLGAADAQLRHELLILRLHLREVYASWAVAAAREERLAAQVHRVAPLVERERARAEAGEVSGLEAGRLRLTVAVLEGDLAAAEAAAAGARARARQWNPQLSLDARPVLPELEREGPPVSPEGAPAVRAAAAELAAARLGLEAASSQVVAPQLSLGWKREEGALDDVSGATFGVAWSLPLFDRGQERRAAAQVRVSAARARLDLVRTETLAAETEARETYRRLSAAHRSARKTLSELEHLWTGAEAAFRQGEASLTDLLETLRTVTDAEMSVLDLHREALTAQRRLEAATGGLASKGTDAPAWAPPRDAADSISTPKETAP